jgi:hypothetical protein
LDYEGRYQYVGETKLDIVASELDTTLYAVIDKAKYPLKNISLDSFVNIQNSPVVFQRDQNNEVVSYKVDGQIFELITKYFEKLEMVPRKSLFGNPDDYAYRKPAEMEDGLKTGDLKDEIENLNSGKK